MEEFTTPLDVFTDKRVRRMFSLLNSEAAKLLAGLRLWHSVDMQVLARFAKEGTARAGDSLERGRLGEESRNNPHGKPFVRVCFGYPEAHMVVKARGFDQIVGELAEQAHGALYPEYALLYPTGKQSEMVCNNKSLGILHVTVEVVYREQSMRQRRHLASHDFESAEITPNGTIRLT